MNRDLLETYLRDDTRRGPAPPGAFSGSAGGAPCGDLVRLSLLASGGHIEGVSFDREGCAASGAVGDTSRVAVELGIRDGLISSWYLLDEPD